MRSGIGLALLAFGPAVASAAPPRIDSVSVQRLAKGYDVVISVSIERPSLLTLSCAAEIDAGDGARIPISWNLGDSRTKTARHEYRRPGSYRVRVAGSGKDACAGQKETTVHVGSGSPAQKKAGTPRCPGGWALVQESVDGPRYTCRARPPVQPLRCAEGTSYFAERGEIGCR